MYFRMEAPLLDWPNFTCMSEIPFFMKHQQFRHVFLKSSAPIPPCKFSQSVKHASRIMRKDMFFFFSVRVVLSCQKASCRDIRKETEELIEVSYRYCSSIQNFTIRTTCTMRGSLIKSPQFQTRSHKGVSQETRMLKFKKKYFKLPN